jgi:2,3-bisphosphoglycerate-independent phosphoglycerate mutase
MAEMHEHHRTFIHAFTDGRDCDPKSGLGFIEKLTSFIKNRPVKIATIIGRYYAMDRDNRWERIKKAYDLMVYGKGSSFETSETSIKASYMHGVTDEFIEPILIDKDGLIEKGDVVICFNFRSDRPREITTALTQRDFPELEMNALDLHYFCMTRYDEAFKNVNIIFDKDNLQNTLGQVLAEHNKTQVRIAETEKYPHVTFFFNGGREIPFKNEHRILVNSPKVATYDLQPEMSAPEVKHEIINYIEKESPNFICLNFANPDMVGHTGVFSAIVSAVESVDQCLEEIVKKGTLLGYEFIVIADHGNADLAINEDMSPNTAHTTNPVPIIFVSQEKHQLKSGKLADIAPTILKRLNVPVPDEMNGENLIF